MKTVSPELAAHLAAEVTTLATCWRLDRRDGITLGFTDHDCALEIGGIEYAASSGFDASAIASSDTLSVDNLDVEGMLDNGAITREDILSGRYDFAEIGIFLVNHRDLSQGPLKLRTGWLGQVTLEEGRFTAEIRGLAQRLAKTLGELYSPSCRAQLGDMRCKVNLAAHTVIGSVEASDSAISFSDSARTEAAATFDGGMVTFAGGANNGMTMEVKEFSGGRFTFVLPLPYPMEAGDAYAAQRGCDKTLGTCRDSFANAVNFRGEPHVPGLDRMLETAGTMAR